MRQVTKMAGVTLLEIMLVLAVAAMVIVMSIRYYQNASQSQQANMAIEEIQAITAAADNLSIGTGSYSGVNFSSLKGIVGSANMKSPTGVPITITGNQASKYQVTMSVGKNVCPIVASRIKTNTKIILTGTGCDATTGVLSYEYDNTK